MISNQLILSSKVRRMTRDRLRVGSFLRSFLAYAGFVGFALSVLVGSVGGAVGNADDASLLGSQSKVVVTDFDVSSSSPSGRCLAGQELGSGDFVVSNAWLFCGRHARRGQVASAFGSRAVAAASLVEMGTRLQI